MKYAIIILLVACVSIFALEELPGWPVETSAYSGFYLGAPITEHIDRDSVLEIYIAGPDSFLRVFHKSGAEYDSLPLTGNVLTHIAYGPVTGSSNEIVLVTEDGDIFVVEPSNLSLISPFDPYSVGASPGPAGPVLWDFDGDSLAEIVVHAGESLHVFKNDGSELEGFPVEVLSGFGPAASPAVGDFTGDGTVEIVAVGYQRLYAFEQTGELLDGFPVQLITDAFSYSAPILLDFDGDDTLEICAGYHSFEGSNYGYIGVWNYHGEAVTGWPDEISDYGGWVYGSPAAGDIDGDGLSEVAITSRNGSGYLYNYNSSFPTGWPQDLDIGALESSPLMCDFTGDGEPEILFLGNDAPGTITCLDAGGTTIDSFPFESDTSWGLSIPTIFDLSIYDSTIEIFAIDIAGNMHLFSHPDNGRSYAMPWKTPRCDYLRTGWLHLRPPDTVVVEETAKDSFLVSWPPVAKYWDFYGYYIYATYDEEDSAGGVFLTATSDTFAIVLPNSGLNYFFVTATTRHNESARSMIAALDTTSGICEKRLPGKFSISVYPNPFNSSVRISFGYGSESAKPLSASPPGACRVEIFDINGRTVYAPSPPVPLPKGEGGNSFSPWEKVAEGRMRAFVWTPDESTPSGVYLIRVKTDNQTLTRRVVFIR